MRPMDATGAVASAAIAAGAAAAAAAASGAALDPSALASFESACRAHEVPAQNAAAAAYLQATEDSPGALPIAHAVLERSADQLAQFHAARVLRRAALRTWAATTPEVRAGRRDWLLSLAAQRGPALGPAALQQVVVALAVLWKRGWLEEDPASRGRLFEHVTRLFAAADQVSGGGGEAGSTSPSSSAAAQPLFLATLGTRLCHTLVQEMGATGEGKATALGLPQEFHRTTAAEFQRHGLRECFVLASRLLFSRLQKGGSAYASPSSPTSSTSPSSSPLSASSSSSSAAVAGGLPPALLHLLLDTLSACLTWDFSGRGGGAALVVRITPGPSWAPLLVDAPSHTALSAILSLYASVRADKPGGTPSTAHLARQLVGLLAGLDGDVFDGRPTAAAYGRRLVMGVCELLSSPLLGAVQSLVSRDRSAGVAFVDESEYVAAADAEAADLCGALALAIRVHKLANLARIGDVSAVLSVTAGLAGAILDHFHSAATELLNAIDGGADSRAKVPAARRAVSHLLEERYGSAMGAVDAAVEVWVTAVAELQSAAALAGGRRPPLSAEEAADANVLAPMLQFAQSHAAGLYDRLVRTRLAMGQAIMRCGIDDDDEFEDKSALKDHMDAVAVVGRFVPAHAIQTLSGRLQAALGRLQALVQSGGGGGGASNPERETRLAQAHEESWWLVGYAGHFLADEPMGEDPSIPEALNALSIAAGKMRDGAGMGGAVGIGGGGPGRAWSPEAAAADPVVSLSSDVLRLVQFECARMLADPALLEQSPLHAQSLAGFLARWSRTYLMSRGGGGEGGHAEAAPSTSLSVAYGGDPQMFAQGPAAGPSESVLRVVPVSPGAVGGRAVLELVIQSAALLLSVWGGGQSNEDVAGSALALLRSVTNAQQAARYAALSPSWAALADACVSLIAGDVPGGAALAASSTSPFAAASSSSSSSSSSFAASAAAVEPWRRSLPLLAQLDADAQGKLASTLLSMTQYIGAESAAHARAKEACADDDAALAAAATADPAGVGEVVARWKAYFVPFVSRAASRFAGVLSSPQLATSPTDPRVEREVVRILCLHTGILTALSRVPDAWHLPATAPCLLACAKLVDVYRAQGAVCAQALRFVLEFLDVECDALREPAQNAAMFGAVAAVFQAYAKHRVGVIKPSSSSSSSVAAAAAGGPGGASKSSGAAALASEAEDEESEDILLLLKILERIADKEQLDLAAPTVASSSSSSGGGADAPAASSAAMMVGLSFIVPTLSASIMARPGLVAAYMSVVTHIMARHPASVARMDPGLFSVFVGNLVAGVAHYDPEVATGALEAVHSMGMYHWRARNRRVGGPVAALDLSPQLVGMPDLFQRFARALLQAAVGPSPMAPGPLDKASDALFACIVCDPQGFQALAQALLAPQAAANPAQGARLAHEFGLLTQSIAAAAATAAATSPTAKSGGGLGSLDFRKAREAFSDPFKRFVSVVRGITTIL
jgi:hypothetical protein